MNSDAEDGFVLVATLWFVALLALAVVLIEGWITTSLDHAAALDKRLKAHTAWLSARERIAFVLVGGSVSPRGVELARRDGASNLSDPEGPAAPVGAPLPTGPFIALDNRPYRVGGVVVRLQDGGGLYDINNANRETLDDLLKSYGVTDADAASLTRALLDYASRPSEVGASGIRNADYAQALLPPPRHNRLLTPWEPLRILGWNRRSALWRGSPPFFEIATPGPIAGLNVNTAPVKLLMASGGMSARDAARLVALRAARPLTDLRDLRGIAGSLNSEERPLGFMPSNIIRLSIIVPGEPLMQILELRMTPSATAPYGIPYMVVLPRREPAAVTDAIPLPELRAAE